MKWGKLAKANQFSGFVLGPDQKIHFYRDTTMGTFSVDVTDCEQFSEDGIHKDWIYGHHGPATCTVCIENAHNDE
jgi:hypothetical protein